MLTDEKFYERALKFAMFANVDNKHFTFDEYKEIIKENQTDKDGNLIYLYATNAIEQHSFIEAAKNKGYDVLLLDGQLDTHFVNHLEQKFENSRFVRVDADVVDKLIAKEDEIKSTLEAKEEALIEPVFETHAPEGGNYQVMFEGLSEDEMPIIITQNEFMRRMKDMSAMGGGGMNFYGQLPDSYNLVVNTNNKLVKEVLSETSASTVKEIEPIDSNITTLEADIKNLEQLKEGKNEEEVPQEEKEKLEELNKQLDEAKTSKTNILKEYGKSNKLAKQMVDLALLANNMLKGEDLTRFVKRSVELIKK
jgi:molecular chaperone HtpG